MLKQIMKYNTKILMKIALTSARNQFFFFWICISRKSKIGMHGQARQLTCIKFDLNPKRATSGDKMCNDHLVLDKLVSPLSVS